MLDILMLIHDLYGYLMFVLKISYFYIVQQLGKQPNKTHIYKIKHSNRAIKLTGLNN